MLLRNNTSGKGKIVTKLTIAVDESSLALLRKHAGSPRGVGTFISKLIKQYDYDEAYGFRSIQRHLSRLDEHIIELLDRKENCMKV
jgi:hypothetical protein